MSFILGLILGAALSQGNVQPEQINPPDGYYAATYIASKPSGDWIFRHHSVVYYTFKTKNECIYYVDNKIPRELVRELGKYKYRFSTDYGIWNCREYSKSEGAPLTDDEAIALIKEFKN